MFRYRNHQTGIVRDISKTIAQFGGSITHSKSMELEGLQFVYMASVYVGDREKANLLRMTLNDMRVNATWIPLDPLNSGAPGYKKHMLKVNGYQRSGLIYTVYFPTTPIFCMFASYHSFTDTC